MLRRRYQALVRLTSIFIFLDQPRLSYFFPTERQLSSDYFLYMMAPLSESKPSGSVEEYDMEHTRVDRIHGDALGGTSHDAQDMHRMGKKQELRVNSVIYYFVCTLLTSMIAKFSSHIYHWICGRSSIDLGKCPLVGSC